MTATAYALFFIGLIDITFILVGYFKGRLINPTEYASPAVYFLASIAASLL